MVQTISGDLIDVSELARPELKGALSYDTSAGSFTDETSEVNDDTADDVTLPPINSTTGDKYYFGGFGTFKGLTIDISTAGSGTWDISWKYWDGGTWANLPNVTDGTSGFTNGGANDVTWDTPGDWDTREIEGIDAYWVRPTVTSFTDLTTSPLGKLATLDGDRTLVAKTRGTITLSPSTNVAESGDHNSLQQDRMATSEAWEVSFEKQLLATLGGLETLGLYDSTNQVLHGRSEDTLDRRLTLEVDIREADGTTLSTYLIRDGLAVLEDANIEEDDFSTTSFTLHTHQRPEKTE